MWYVLNSDGKIMARGVDNCAPDEDTITSLKNPDTNIKSGLMIKLQQKSKRKLKRTQLCNFL